MAYAQTADTHKTVFGNKRVHYGTFTQGSGDSGGAVATGLSRTVEVFFMTGLKNWSASGGTVTSITLDPGGNVTGSWMAIGY